MPAMLIASVIPPGGWHISLGVACGATYACAMAGLLLAALCWMVWHLAPHNISMLAFEKEAIAHGEWWRLWTAHFTHFSHAQLIINSAMLTVAGLIAGRYTKIWQLIFSLLTAMPIIAGLLLLTSPHLLFFRGATGIAAMMWVLAAWFLLVEEKRFSWRYWVGLCFLLLFTGKAGMEGLILLSPDSHRMSGFQAAWLAQLYGALLGMAFFNGLHQLHMTRNEKNPQYRGPYERLPERRRSK